MKKKIWISVAAIALILCCTIGGTLAWLKTSTPEVKNIFTVGDINIELKETENLDLKMVPGNKIFKDPFVTVKTDSEACWLFVKVGESANLKDFIEYNVNTADGEWKLVPDETHVYYREVDAATAKAGATYSILTDNKVTVKTDVTKTKLNGLEKATYPTLTFVAYAVQSDNISDVNTAWTEAQKAD